MKIFISMYKKIDMFQIAHIPKKNKENTYFCSHFRNENILIYKIRTRK
jgi:hypothetical protein